MKRKNLLISLLGTSLTLIMTPAFSFDLVNSLFANAVSNPCLINAEKKLFSCAKPEQMTEIAQVNKDKSFTQLIKGIVQSESSFIPHTQGSDSGFIKMDYAYYPKPDDFNFTTNRSAAWFESYCSVSNGLVKKNKNFYICLPKDDKGGHPMFGMAIDYGVHPSQDSLAKPYYTKILICGNAPDVKKFMNVGKEFSIGDQTTMGMVIEVKPPLAKIQTEDGGKTTEKWVKIDDLESKK